MDLARRFRFSWSAFVAMVVKEFVQMRRDRVTLAMMLGIPLLQLLLFGFAINTNPKQLPTAVVAGDQGPLTRGVMTALQNTGYFRVTVLTSSSRYADRLLERGRVQFVVTIPVDFERRLAAGSRPAMLIEADATDPTAINNALAAAAQPRNWVLDDVLSGPLAARLGEPPGFEVVIHRRYNPEVITQYNIVPGLIGVILTQTMVIITSIAVTRERERGTLETLLVMPIGPLAVMMGKIFPYIFVGYFQLAIIVAAAHFIFGVPVFGSLALLSVVTIVFIASNLAIGFIFSTVAKSQLEAVQMTFFFFLPSILLSGFMFPFRGMPEWAQVIGSALPLTHYLRVVRGILLKGFGAPEVAPHLGPMFVILLVIVIAALVRYRETLD
ncbi:MAG: ABC transporter permease [Alphaproteobacteria bacterium]|nr:MAG: ABC transporter permease [Alphaproteobacteria bacterium]